jgi:hypothetical protein
MARLKVCECFGRFLFSDELMQQGASGDPVVRVRQHFEREVAMTKRPLAARLPAG